jgi:hypothetical protein
MHSVAAANVIVDWLAIEGVLPSSLPTILSGMPLPGVAGCTFMALSLSSRSRDSLMPLLNSSRQQQQGPSDQVAFCTKPKPRK